MNRLLTTLALVSISSVTFAATSPKNLVERPITLADGELQVAGAIQYGEKVDGEKEWNLVPHFAYGITDDLTVSLGEVRYRFLERRNNKTGLELTTGISYAGRLKAGDADDAHGGKIDVVGKYVFTSDTAVAFSLGYVHWQDFDLDKVDWQGEDNKDRSEIRYSASLLQNLSNDVTFIASYTYRDLKDFQQNSAQAASVGLNYAYSNNIDLGLFGRYSDYNPAENGFSNDGALERSAGVYMSYRF
jgi:opacity protein-like surface antigen